MIIKLKEEIPEGKWWSIYAGKTLNVEEIIPVMGYRLDNEKDDDVQFFIPEDAVASIVEEIEV